MDRNECLDLPCMNGASCINLEPKFRYRCVCLDGFWGENCQLVQEGQTLKLSMGALAAILVCLLVILSEHQNKTKEISRSHSSSICKFMSIHIIRYTHIYYNRGNDSNARTHSLTQISSNAFYFHFLFRCPEHLSSSTSDPIQLDCSLRFRNGNSFTTFCNSNHECVSRTGRTAYTKCQFIGNIFLSFIAMRRSSIRSKEFRYMHSSRRMDGSLSGQSICVRFACGIIEMGAAAHHTFRLSHNQRQQCLTGASAIRIDQKSITLKCNE